MGRNALTHLLLLLVTLAGCREVEPQPALPDATRPDAAMDKSSACASTFGDALTASFGRLDGTILAVVPPDNMTCALPNGTHLVLQVTMNGAAYRMVINVMSTSSDYHVWLGDTVAPLAGGPWSEGWHTDVALDYVTTLGVSKSAFSEATLDVAVDRLENALELGAHVSVFATSSGGVNASGAHLVHRNVPDADGAVVIDPESATPRYLLSAFPEQVF